MWKIKWEKKALKELSKLDRQAQKQIKDFIDDRLIPCDDPEIIGKKLSGSVLGSYIRYRTGNYRIICDVQKNIITINVLKVGHRKEVYRG